MIRFEDARAWLFTRALPFWAERGVDWIDGGFVERLESDGSASSAPVKRVRVQARQTYCFAHAHLMGWSGPGRDLAERGWRYLQAHARRPDGLWVRALNRRGGVSDPAADLYDIAFVLFAHAWWGRIADAEEAAASARATLDALDRTLALAGGGWRAAEDWTGPRLQNPHMHMFEAMVELAETTGDARFFETARTLGKLFRGALFDADRGTLAENFEPDSWTRCSPVVVEPGHQFEWSWLLRRAGPLLDLDFSAEADALHLFAEARGVEPESGLTYDEVDGQGRVLSPDHRAWTQTEALKSHLARFERTGAVDRRRIAQITDNLLGRYLTPDGAWRDHLRADGSVRSGHIPASTFYHVLLAFSELLRLEPALTATP